MNPKDVIAQAEKEFAEKFGKDSEMAKFLTLKYGTNIQHLRVEELIKQFIFSSYTKDLLQSVEKMWNDYKNTEVFNTTDYTMDGETDTPCVPIDGFETALSDIISKLK